MALVKLSELRSHLASLEYIASESIRDRYKCPIGTNVSHTHTFQLLLWVLCAQKLYLKSQLSQNHHDVHLECNLFLRLSNLSIEFFCRMYRLMFNDKEGMSKSRRDLAFSPPNVWIDLGLKEHLGTGLRVCSTPIYQTRRLQCWMRSLTSHHRRTQTLSR